MRYDLAVLTHGRGGFDEALNRFLEFAHPAPQRIVVYGDGIFPNVRAEWSRRVAQTGRTHGVRTIACVEPARGFCGATERLWRLAGDSQAPYVFWLEHDFLLLRPVVLEDLAAVLDGDDRLAQMALVRGPVNAVELAGGGLVESRPGEFAPQEGPHGSWLRHTSFMTTNPSLMRTRFMVENPWPSCPAECEGRFGLDLVAAGFHFGLWGTGERWCDHVGVRTGWGY